MIMKAIKIISVFFSVVLLFNISVAEIFGQSPQNTKPSEALASGTDKKTTQPSAEKVEKAEISKVQKFPEQTEAENLSKNQNNERYPIGYQDTLEIQVVKHPELSQIVAVNTDGTINLPRIDEPITAVCKTERELKDNITALYKTYLRAPFVNVRLIDQKSQPFAVMGAVPKPGSFFLTRKIQLLGLLSLAGGYDVEKAGVKINVARMGNFSGCKENDAALDKNDDVFFLSFNLKDVLDGKQNPWMQPGDIVSVLEAEEIFVVGSVYKPAKIPLKGTVTLTQAIGAAGGLEQTAKTNKVVIQRQAPGSLVKTQLVFNLKDIQDKKVPDPQLQANDIVEVGTDNVKTVRNGILKALTGGLGNIFFKIP